MPRYPLPPVTPALRRRTLLPFLLLIVWFYGLQPSPTGAAALDDRIAGDPDVPWQISADAVDYDAETTTYHASGNVVIEKADTRLMADRVAFNHEAMTASASGHVIMTVGGDVLTGERLDLDLNRETGVVYGGSVFLQENHFYIRGQRIEKTGRDTYRAEQASITTCDGDRPDWSITARTVNVTIDGYGRASHAVFKARKVPLVYTPYLLFPVKTKRQSGLLLPEAGISDRQGFFWDQPLFWAINESSDATLYADYMAKRGTKLGVEYRYALSEASMGTIMADGLKDRQRDDGSEASTKSWGYGGDDVDRPNSDRYWLRAKMDQALFGGATASLDLDVVSDQDYLTEFREGRSGYYASRDAFLETFGRDLDTYDETTRTNRLNVNKTWSRYSLNGDLLWNDNVINRRWRETDDTLQRMPTIEFNGAKQRAFGSGVFWNLDSAYDYFYREDGQRGHRLDAHPRLYLPMQWQRYLSIEPSAGWRHTTWVMDRWEDERLDEHSYRQIYDLALDLSTELSKVMESPVPAVERIRHSIKPRVIYQYIPDQDQSDLPQFTDIDRIAAANQVTYSLTNTFTTRTEKPMPVPAPAPASAPMSSAAITALPQPPRTLSPFGGDFDYQRICRFYLEQTYDIGAARRDDPEPFSDIYGELEVALGRYLGVDADASYDTYQTRFSSHNAGISVADNRGDRLWVEHRYTADINESIRSVLSVPVTDRLTVRGEYERNLLTDEEIIKGAGFVYTAQCWAVDFFYAVEGDDQRFSVFIDLTGLGGFGK